MSNSRKDDNENHRRLVEQEREREARREADLAQLEAVDRHCDHMQCLLDGVAEREAVKR